MPQRNRTCSQCSVYSVIRPAYGNRLLLPRQLVKDRVILSCTLFPLL